jgi:hypothetical protein
MLEDYPKKREACDLTSEEKNYLITHGLGKDSKKFFTKFAEMIKRHETNSSK